MPQDVLMARCQWTYPGWYHRIDDVGRVGIPHAQKSERRARMKARHTEIHLPSCSGSLRPFASFRNPREKPRYKGRTHFRPSGTGEGEDIVGSTNERRIQGSCLGGASCWAVLGCQPTFVSRDLQDQHGAKAGSSTTSFTDGPLRDT